MTTKSAAKPRRQSRWTRRCFKEGATTKREWGSGIGKRLKAKGGRIKPKVENRWWVEVERRGTSVEG